MRQLRLVREACWVVVATVLASAANAQRFEGIITMKLSGGNIAAAIGGRGGDGRGGVARGGDVTVGGARSGGRPGASGTDPQAETMRAALSGGLNTIEYMTRRGKIRVGVAGAAGAPSPAAIIYVPDEGLMYTLLPPISMYSEMSMADLQANLPARPSDSTSTGAARVLPRAPTVTHTKQFELVAGHKCEHVTVTAGPQKTDICMGKGLGVFVMPAGLGRAEGWDRVMADENGFPLKVTQANGTVTMEVTRIERKALPESLFTVPDTYSKMPDMFRRPPG